MLIDIFNEALKNIAHSFLKVRDDSISAIRFRTTAKGKLPHLSYIFHNPEPLGTKFKTVTCPVTGALIFVEVQRLRLGMDQSKYLKKLGSTADCTKKMMEATKEWLSCNQFYS